MVTDILNVNLTQIKNMDALFVLLFLIVLILNIYIVVIINKLNKLQKSIDELRYFVNKLRNKD